MSGEEPLVHRTFCPVIHKKFPESLIWVPICPINVMSDLVFKHNADLIRDKLGYHLVPNRMFTFVTAEFGILDENWGSYSGNSSSAKIRGGDNTGVNKSYRFLTLSVLMLITNKPL